MIQHLTCRFIDHRVTIYHNIFLSIIVSPSITIFFYRSVSPSITIFFCKSLPCEFSHCIFHQLLIMYFLINDLLLSKFIQARCTRGGIWTKNNLLVLCDGVFDGFFKLFLCFHSVLTRYIQLFCKF